MKKSRIVTFVGTFIIVTVLFSTVGKNCTYEKRINFTSTKDLLEELNSKPLAAFKNENKNQYNIVYSDNFNECLSKRKRITSSGIEYSKLNVKTNDNGNSEEDKKRIRDNYLSLGKNIKSFNEPEKMEAYNLVGTCENIYTKNMEKINMDVVMIDEGEGWVIDYFMINPQGDQHDSNKYK